MCRELNDLMLGSILTDMHGKAFNFAPDLPGIVWTNWIAFRSKTFRMPAIKYKECGGDYLNKMLCVVEDGIAMATYDGMYVMIGTFELKENRDQVDRW